MANQLGSGLRFGKYEVLATVGRGAIGIVYKAVDPQLNRVVAVKALKSVFLGNPSDGENLELERFYRESQLAARLRHPNIVTIYDVGSTELGTPFIVMDYLEGPTLRQLFDQYQKFPPEYAVHYLEQLASAIDYAHREGVLHRDLNPDNIIFDKEERPYILDFSLAKICEVSITPTGAVLGSPGYIAPELITGGKPDNAADLFSFAVIAFEMLTGSRPFPGTDIIKTAFAVVREQPLSFAALGSTLSPRLESVLGKGLAKDKLHRYVTASEFVADIRASLTEFSTDKPSSSSQDFHIEDRFVLGDEIDYSDDVREVRHARRKFPVVAVPLLVLIAVIGFLYTKRSPTVKTSAELTERELVQVVAEADETTKARIVQELNRANRSDAAAILFYQQMLNDSDYLVRGYAAQALARFGGPETLGILEARLPKEDNDLVRTILKDTIAERKRHQGK